MFRLNSTSEPISLLDTFQTVIERIASKLDSLPRFLHFTPSITTLVELKNADLKVTSLLQSIVNQDSLTGFSEQELRELEQIYPQLNIIKDVFEPYIATNITLSSSVCQDNLSLCLLSIPNYPGLDKKVAWDNRKLIIRSFENEKTKLQDRVAEQNARVQEFNSYPDIPHTRFIKEFEKFYFEVSDGVPYDDVVELFDNIQTTQKVPFINLRSFYKVHIGFVPDPRWLNQKTILPDKLIQLWVNNEKETLLREIKDPYKKFNEVLLTLGQNLNGQRVIQATVNMKVDKRHDTRQALIENLLQTFTYQINMPALQVSDLTSIGYVYYPNETLDTTVWSDMCMNNSFFNSIFAVDESVRLSKIKKNLLVRNLLGRESISLRYNIGQKGDLPEGIVDKQKYIRARITNATDIDIPDLIDILSRVISAYKVNYESVVHKYKRYIKSFTPEPLLQPIAKQTDDSLKALAPQIFVSNYSRVCTSPPVIVNDSEAKEREDQGRSVMKFPLYGEGALAPMNFVCPSDSMPYPGLRSNDLVNKDTFDVLPCCYRKDQRLKLGTKYGEYLKGVKVKRREQTKDVTVTKKILKFDAHGILPKNITELLQLSTPPMQNFVRRGVSRSRLSAIECVHVALNPYATKAQIQELTKQTFVKMQTLNYATSARQEIYDLKPDEILALMQVEDFRASWYVNALEAFFSEYDITIYIFSDAEDGSLIVPPHFMAYYKLQPRSKVILIYEHYGSDTDNVKYPQSELIIRTYPDRQRPTFTYSKLDPTVSIVFQAFLSLTEKFKFSHQIAPLTVTPIPIQSQRLDSYGKCRVVNSGTVSIVVEPLPPYAVPEVDDIRRVRLDVALDFIRQYDIPIVEQRKSDTHLKELVIYLGTCKGSLLIKEDLSKALPGLVMLDEVYDIFGDGDEGSNPLEIFSQQQKFSNILTNNFLYAASIYFSSRKFTKANLRTFISEVISLDKHLAYKSGPKFNSPENISLDPIPQRLSLTIPSLEIVKRLLYYLQLYVTKLPEQFAEFKNKTFIPDYYKGPLDFTSYPNEYILLSTPSVLDYMNQNKLFKNRYVIPYVEPAKSEPYFFQNNLLGERLYLAQNAPSYEYANYIMYYWRFMNRNPGISSEGRAEDVNMDTNHEVDLDLNLDDVEVEDKVEDLEDKVPYISFEVYKYVNENQIELIRGDGNRKDKVLAYKVDNKVKYTVLLIE